ncbi:MAG TPA: glycoside hydrolase family 28 protein [Tepidisphaeraceae bacterium]|nr:glycoside hydrolase family 28 protein [Tepidisphaeraceae bacterium]
MIRFTRLALISLVVTLSLNAKLIDVRSVGATGDGKSLDTPAINKAIEHANGNGGGTVYFPAGTYLCYSIHLKSNVALYLDQGATILAADNPIDPTVPGYDAPEPNEWDPYEDFGHSHWHNSLIWGENLENVSILGPGMIDGKGLTTGENPRNKKGAERQKVEPPATNRATTKFGYPSPIDTLPAGIGNKAIALKRCRNVTFKDFTIHRGGHFAILCTGVDNWTLDNLKIDTNRDGVDLDCCRNVRMSNCTINSPHDDGICPKSSFALGEAIATENVTITNCQVSGWEVGSMLDGTYRKGNGPGTGRIKFGTESNGGFKNITISNCLFAYCCGLALETVDGGLLEDVTITNITMRDIANAPIFMRLGARLRGPEGTKPGQLRRVTISNVECWNAGLPSIISGIPDHDIEDIRISNIRVHAKGGGTREQATTKPAENEKRYPEPSMFGEMPAYGFYLRHVRGIELIDVKLSYEKTDLRPAIVLDDVKEIELARVKAQHEAGVEEIVK